MLKSNHETFYQWAKDDDEHPYDYLEVCLKVLVAPPNDVPMSSLVCESMVGTGTGTGYSSNAAHLCSLSSAKYLVSTVKWHTVTSQHSRAQCG